MVLVVNKMNFHYLPLSKEAKSTILTKLDAIHSEWMNSWFAKKTEKNQIKLELTVASKEQLINKGNSDTFCCYQPRTKGVISNTKDLNLGVELNQSIKNFILENTTGYSIQELANSRINTQEFIQTIFLDLVKRICNHTDIHQVSSDFYLSELNRLPENSQHLVGGELKIEYCNQALFIFVPNVILKSLIKTEEAESKPIKLMTREACVADIPVKLSAKIEGFNLLLGDLKTLQPGDVLTTRQEKSQQLTLHANHKVIKAGNISLGQCDGNKAIRISTTN